MNTTKKGQGEIFGLALVFVVLILGIIIYSQFSLLNPKYEEDSFKEQRYKALAENTILSIKKVSTKCSVQTGKNSLEDLINYCLSYATSNEHDPDITCDDGDVVNSCEYSFRVLNKTLQSLFEKNGDGIANAGYPFSLYIENPNLNHKVWHNRTITNMHVSDLTETPYDYEGSTRDITLYVTNYNFSSISFDDRNDPKYYLRNGYNRVNAGKDTLTTGRVNLEFSLDFYYR